MSDSTWYKNAVVYQLHVRAFHDSDGNGIGDFRGLAEKLDYVQALGATAIWLLPFYPSPLKDDGYDIADYTDVHPSYGTLDDFRAFLEEAHRRELRVITELVVNHTSDQHPWFQRARKAPKGSPERDFYVWNDDPDRYREARIIFKDFEHSNWEWDHAAGQYYWHRFYKHQPDLNFENPAVREALFEVLDFWLEMGVDGMRLDAVPYLHEREGTTCENLPETHEELKALRAHVDSKFDDRMLLAEANQWPEDAVAYFGDGDECHTCFHFPLMPRLYMAVEREDRFPIIDILEQTPPIPENCQWMTFLRNHDELTLEMVTDEERDHMYRSFAADPRARINLGIRRRLAPLLESDRRKIELLNVLLFTLPGTPILYYGDEIGMGDNIYLGDRDSVRTPMQWSIDRNAGFSKGNPQQLYLPVVVDPQFHYTTINVEAQEANPHSLLRWMRRLIKLVRKQYDVFGQGTVEFLRPENPRVLTFIRRHDDETALVVVNLSRHAQYVELNLGEFQGLVPVELFGRTRFPPIGELPYLLSLGPHASYLFSFERQWEEVAQAEAPPLPRLAVGPDEFWREILRGRASARFEQALGRFVRMRWFSTSSRNVRSVTVEGAIPLEREGETTVHVLMLTVAFSDSQTETVALPATIAEGRWGEQVRREHPATAIVRLCPDLAEDDDGADEDDEETIAQHTLIYDAAFETPTAEALLRLLVDDGRVSEDTAPAILRGYVHKSLAGLSDDVARRATVRWVRDEVARTDHAHESFVVNDRHVLTLYRRLESGRNLDAEMGIFLQERGHENLAPHVRATLELLRSDGAQTTFAILRELLPAETSGEALAHDEFGRFLEHVGTITEPDAVAALRPPEGYWLGHGEDEVPRQVIEALGPFLSEVTQLGARVAEFHLAVATASDVADFAPVPYTRYDARSLFQTIRTTVRRTFEDVRRRRSDWPEPLASTAERVLAIESDLLERYRETTKGPLTGQRMRCHGDLRLDCVVHVGNDFRIVDFRGDSTRPLAERRIKRSPLRDVAGLVTSLHRISHRNVVEETAESEGVAARRGDTERWSDFWAAWTTAVTLRSYFRAADAGEFLPKSDEERVQLLRMQVMDAAVVELRRSLGRSGPEIRDALAAVERHHAAMSGVPAGVGSPLGEPAAEETTAVRLGTENSQP